MLDFVLVYALAVSINFLLRPYIVIPLVGIIVAFFFNPGAIMRWQIIAVFIVIGLLMTLFEYFFGKTRIRFLDARMSIYFHSIPKEMSPKDFRLYMATFLPSLVVFFVLIYTACIAFSLPFTNPLITSLIVTMVCVLLYAANEFIVRPAFNINGSRPIPQKQFEIHKAAESGDLEQLQAMIEAKADLNQKTNKNMAPLHFTISAGKYDATKLLLESGADVNLLGNDFIPRTPLMFAADMGDRATVELLLEHGADLHAVIHDRNNVLYYARQHLDIFDLLIKKGVDYKVINQYNASLLSIAAGMELDFTPHPGADKLVHYLLDIGMPANGLPEEKDTPIVEAAGARNLDVIKTLIAYKADADKPDRYHRTALIQTVAHGNLELVRYLLENGADRNRKGRTLNMGEDVSPLELARSREDNYMDSEAKETNDKIIQLLE